MTRKAPVTEQMMQEALGDKDITLFAQEGPLWTNKAARLCQDRWYFLFTKPIDIREQTYPIHLGIYLKGMGPSSLNHNLLASWSIVIGDEWYQHKGSTERRTFPSGYAIKDNISIRVGTYFDEEAYHSWENVFHDRRNADAFNRLVTAYPPAPCHRVLSQKGYGGRGVGFNHIIPEMRQAWRVWHEWLVAASVLSIW